MKYVCNRCPTLSKDPAVKTNSHGNIKRKVARPRKSFLGDQADVIALLPPHVACLWDFTDTGHTICDSTIIDLLRALATRTSWSAIAETINEMKTTTWMKKVTRQYLLLCELLTLRPQSVPRAMPSEYQINSKWLGNLFASDAETRREEVKAELDAEKGHDLSELLNEAVRIAYFMHASGRSLHHVRQTCPIAVRIALLITRLDLIGEHKITSVDPWISHPILKSESRGH